MFSNRALQSSTTATNFWPLPNDMARNQPKRKCPKTYCALVMINEKLLV